MQFNGQNLYDLTSKLLLGYQMDTTTFFWLLNLSKSNREQSRPWVILRKKDTSNIATPQQNTINNSMYLTPFTLPSDFLNHYSPNRSLVGVAQDGITFRWYKEIPLERMHEYKDDNSKFYIDLKNKKFFLCGILDQQYTLNEFYIAGSADIDAETEWAFPGQFAPILAYDVAKTYREMFDYDIVNVQQGEMIAKGAAVIEKMMIEWDGGLQESQLEGIDNYQGIGSGSSFNSNIVGDNNN
jgi:hypothetical protein